MQWRKRPKKRVAAANFGAGEKVEEVEGKGSDYDMKQGKGSNRVLSRERENKVAEATGGIASTNEQV
ncbi:hypothetical protein GW17_00019090 [Ensete ventricosum]|nr:hypothetical protein GW17_00019090 [Ensete ventricosum]